MSLLEYGLSPRTRALAEYGAAWCEYRLGNHCEAVKRFTAALQGPLSDDWKHSCRLAGAENSLLCGDREAARRTIEELLRLPGLSRTETQRASLLLGQLLYDAAEYEAAVGAFETALAIRKPPEARAWALFGAAAASFALDDYESAQRHFRSLERLEQGSDREAATLYGLGLSALQLGDHGRALEASRSVIKAARREVCASYISQTRVGDITWLPQG